MIRRNRTPRPDIRRFGRLVLLLGLLWPTLGGCSSLSPAPQPPDTSTAQAQVEPLIEAMGQRLALMPGVAAWKLEHHKPVRDRPRELVVLTAAVEAVRTAAETHGASPFPEAAVRDFYQAQIDTAVAIQENILSRPTRVASRTPDLLTEIRPELDRLGRRIARLLIDQPTRVDSDRLSRLAEIHWQVEGLDTESKERLITALERLLRSREPIE